jgi:hypothetical protein
MAVAGYVGQAYLILSATGHATITVTFSKACGASGLLAVWVDEFAPPSGETVSYDDGEVGSGTGTINTPTIPVSGSNELVTSVASDEWSVGEATGAWTLNDGGVQHSCNAAHILSVSANTAVGYLGYSGKAYAAVGMSFKAAAVVTAAVTGTATASITEADIVAGGKTIILTLTNDTWIAA